MKNDLQDDLVLERIHHQLFHLVHSIDKLTEEIGFLVKGMTNEFGEELYKKRIEEK